MGQLMNNRAKAQKQLQVISVPELIVDGTSTPAFVGKGNLCRIEGTSGGFVRFAKSGDTDAPSSSTRETIKTSAAFFYTIATEDYIICSASMRVEVTKD